MKTFVIGSSKGIGKAIYERLQKDGHTVLGFARKEADRTLDLSWNSDVLKAVLQDSVKEIGGLDAIVVSAAMGIYLAPLELTEDRILEVFRTNVLGPIQVYKSLLRPLLKSRGKIIYLTSTAARKPGDAGLSIYAAAKGAMNSFVLNEGRRLIRHGVAMTAISPGWVDTQMTGDIKPRKRKKSERAVPAGRFGTPEEVANFTMGILNSSNWCVAANIYDVSGGA